MEVNKVYSMLMDAPFSFALHRIIDDGGTNKTIDYEFVVVNPVFERTFGIGNDILQGRTTNQLFPVNENFGLRSIYDKISSGNCTTTFEQYIPGSGRLFLVNIWHTSEHLLAITLTDILSSRQSMEPGYLKDFQYQMLWNSNLFGVIIADKNGNYVDANQEACRMTGYSCDELKTMNVLSLIDPDTKEESRGHFERIAKTGKAYGEAAYFTKSGEKRWWNVVATRLSDDYILGMHEDITKRKRDEEKFRQLAQVCAASTDVIVVIGADYCYKYANEVYLRKRNLHPADIIGHHMIDIVGVEKFEELGKPQVDAALRGEMVESLEWSDFGGNEQHYLSVHVAPYREDDGTITGVVMSGREITEQKRAEENLKVSERRFSQLIHNSYDTIVILDSNGIQRYVSPSAEKVHGYSTKELVDIPVIEVMIHPDDQASVLATFLNIIESGSGSVQYRHRRKEGGWVYLEAYGTNQLENPDIKGVVVNVRDITERKLADQKMRENEALLARSQQIAHVGSWKLDAQANQLEWSDEVFRIFGCEPKDFGGTTEAFFDFVHPDDREMVDEAFNSSLFEKRDSYDIIHRIVRKTTGEIRYVHERATHFYDADRVYIHSIGMVQDITEQKHHEAELKQIQKNLAEKEAQYRLLAENSQDLIYVYTLVPEPRYEYISPSCLQITGYSPEEGYADPFAYHKFINTSEGVEKFTNFLIDPNQPSVIEEEWKRKDGSSIWVEQVLSRNFDKNGQLISFQSTVRDISARKRAEEALLTSDNIVRTIPSGLFIYQFTPPDKLYLLHGNPAAEKLSGLKVAEYIGKEFNELWPLAGQSGLTHAYLNVIETGKTFETEDLYYQDNRLSGAFRIRAFKLPGERLAVAFENITERKQAEAELKASEKKYRELSTLMRLMTDNMPDMLWAKNLNKEYIFTNKALCNNLLGVDDTNEPLGKTDMFFAMQQRNSHSDNPQWHSFGEICRDSDSITMQELKPMQFDEFSNVKGNFLYLDVYKAPLFDEQGQLIGVVGSARDITERKALEDKLLQQTRLRELLMEISSGFINIALDKVEASVYDALRKMGSFVNADRAYTFDYDWQNEVCYNTYEWCNEGISAQIQNLQSIPLSLMINAVEEHRLGNTVCIHDVSTMPEGEARQLVESQEVLSFIMVPMMNENHCLGFVGFDSVREKHDFSQVEIHLLRLFAQSLANVKLRQIMEEKLVDAKEQAEESDRLKSAFLANMSHEIRTPMNGILGFAELLKRPDLSGSVQHDYIEIIEKSGKRMLNIINDIIDISKIESGLMELKMAESNLCEQIEYVHAFFKPEAEAKGVRLSVNNALTRTEATITTDREKVYAILTNLIKNAIKYTHEGMIELGCSLKGDIVEFYVKDTGIGISKDRLEAIFERFVQADIEDRMAYQGAGLGLAITKAYIEMLGGTIWVESELGKGSTFYFTMPYKAELKHKNSSMNSMDSDAKEEPGKLKILVVEDDFVSELLFDAMLTNYSKEILKARSGMDAVKMAKNNPDIDLILMDVQLPEFNGHEATRRIRQFNTNVVIIAQTAFGLAGDREKALEAGCTDYIAKPIDRNELNRLIMKYFNNH